MNVVQPIKSETDIRNLKNYLKDRNPRDYVLLVLGMNSGLRINDLLHLTIGDVWDDKTKKPRDRIRVIERKTHKTKDFPLSDQTKKVIADYVKTRPDAKMSDPLFVSRGNAFLTRQQAWNILNSAAQAVGIREPIGTHTLRKTFGYHLYKKGIDITRIQAMLNHSSPSVTLRYIGITKEELDQIYITLNL